MYGLVEVNVTVIRKAYRFLKSDPSLNPEENAEKKPFKNVKEALKDKKCIFTKEQLEALTRNPIRDSLRILHIHRRNNANKNRDRWDNPRYYRIL